jgi:hypothetical protein
MNRGSPMAEAANGLVFGAAADTALRAIDCVACSA